ncbi:MAG TPA: ATP-binding protein [Phycisphaerae bacterium]|nr:ATP-binding protein [Phycisphaerae bacterium]
MLIQFKVANFQCFRDEVTLNLQPGGRDTRLLGNIWQGHRYRALKSAAIFGPNASGKTSLLHALYVFARFVRDSATRMNVGDPIRGISPFRLAGATCKEPSCFEVLIELEGVGYRYRLEATAERVLHELVERQDSAKGAGWLKLIDRDAKQGHVALHERLGAQARRDQIVQDTRDNALILSRAAERNVKPVVPLFNWFRQRVHHQNVGAGAPPDMMELTSIARSAADDPKLLRRLSDFIRDADTGIIRVDTEAVPVAVDGFLIDHPDNLSAKEKAAISELGKALNGLLKLHGEAEGENGVERTGKLVRFFTEHGASGEAPVRFGLSDESAGTIRYLLLIGTLLQRLSSEDLLAVDEMHTSLHPQLARRVVQMAHSPEFGRAGAQLLFTTHDVTLLDPDLLRRDQIILTQKRPEGAAEIYSLWDFEDMPRNTAAWARNYLAGRFGGVPVFGPSLADIPQVDQPTPVESLATETVEAE